MKYVYIIIKILLWSYYIIIIIIELLYKYNFVLFLLTNINKD